jgi:hypothetical protein
MRLHRGKPTDQYGANGSNIFNAMCNNLGFHLEKSTHSFHVDFSPFFNSLLG